MLNNFYRLKNQKKKRAEAKADFIFEPDKDVLIEELMPKILNTQLYKAILDANASEHGARMTAMDKATENAERTIKSIKNKLQPCKAGCYYNRTYRNCKWCGSIAGIITALWQTDKFWNLNLINSSFKRLGYGTFSNNPTY